MRFQYQAESRWIRHITAMILVFAGWPVAMAQTIDINLSDDTAQFRYITPVGFQNRFGGVELDLGFLSTTSDDVMGIVGFQAVDEAGSESPGLKVGVGIKGFAGTIESSDVYAITLGAEGRFAPPEMNRFGLYGSVHFAPDVVTFGDTERLVYITVHLEYEVLSQATVYLGYRKIRANLTGGDDVSIDNGAHIGLQFLF